MSEIFDVEIKNISKFYGAKKAVDNFSLKVKAGSFTTLLGPSGCGKTTLLRIISGFLKQDNGEIFICGENQKNIPPEKRNIGIVFQDYALFTHLTAFKNIEYGLKVRNVPSYRRKTLVEEIAHTLGLCDELYKFPHEMSGGQQQRVALGRVLVLKPKILLMDEPLSNLDAKLRTRVSGEFKDLQNKLGITTIYVTHDQSEALSISDQIAIMQNGSLMQCASPSEIYLTPTSKFTADFVGTANFLHSTNEATKKESEFVVRPEWISIFTKDEINNLSGDIQKNNFIDLKDNLIKCKIVSSYYFGATVTYRLFILEIPQKCEYKFPQEILVSVNLTEHSQIINNDTIVFAAVNKTWQIK